MLGHNPESYDFISKIHKSWFKKDEIINKTRGLFLFQTHQIKIKEAFSLKKTSCFFLFLLIGESLGKRNDGPEAHPKKIQLAGS